MPPRGPSITRRMVATARDRAKRHPIVTITGPRQSGKTTLCKTAFPKLHYVNLEDPTTRERALADPTSFVAQRVAGAIFDEVQRAPEVLSALQVIVDATPGNGRFVLLGSHNFQLQSSIAQSLAGRTAVLDLLPLAIDELRQFPNAPTGLADTMLAGGYPRIFDQRLPAAEFLADYVRTYVERDVRLLLNVTDLGAFQTFLRLCAGRTAGLLNLSSLASDCGITHPTAKAWIGVLETSYLVRRIQPWSMSLGKRLVKSPKLHLLDSGLASWLLGLRTPEQFDTHPLRGQIFESWIVAEVLKARANAGIGDPVWFYRDQSGAEADLLFDAGRRRILIEAKSGSRVAPDTIASLQAIASRMSAQQRGLRVETFVVHGGEERDVVNGTTLLPWSQIGEVDWH